MGFRLLSGQVKLPSNLTYSSQNKQKQHALRTPLAVEGQLVCFCSDDSQRTFVLAKRTLTDAKVQAIESENETVVKMFTDSTDLISGVYEGGLKTWEASYDLVQFLRFYLEGTNMQDLKVLELGCGSALPGCFCLSRGAHVDFQDFNEEAINYLTIPNAMLNSLYRPNHPKHPGNSYYRSNLDCVAEEDGFFDSMLYPDDIVPARFYSGDWGSLKFDETYDLVLSSETLYCAESIPSFVKVLYSSLKVTGRALIASKTNYFGCSGGLELFKEAIRELFDFQVVYSSQESVRREILLLTKTESR